MATTTNYSWSTPDDTALVKDGAAAIRSLGTAIDTTVFTNAGAAINKTIIDAKGDLIVGSAADTAARLAVGGTNGHVLTVNSGATNGVEWAAAAGGSVGLVGSSDFTTSSSVVINNCFSSTYDYYLFYFELDAVSAANPGFGLKLRVSGTSATNNYDFARQNVEISSGVASSAGATNQAAFAFFGADTTYPTRSAYVTQLIDPGTAKITKLFVDGFQHTSSTGYLQAAKGIHTLATAYDGLEITVSTGTISGNMRVYGYAKS